jgi:aryl-alcohol dehydrogenase-like predicted oxidoreductase
MTMSWAYFDPTSSEEESVAVLQRALDLGVSFFDTSDVYGPFTNEELVGRALQGRQGDAVLATKVGLVVGANGGYPLLPDGRPEHIRTAVVDSLRRLGTDAIDLYYLHRVDPEVPFEEQWGTLSELVEAGKVRWLGLSEVDVPLLERAAAIHPVTALQSELSLWTRDPLPEVLPWCAEHDVAFVPFSPLGRGYLTGTVRRAEFEELDFRSSNPRFTQEALDGNRAIVEGIGRVAGRYGATPAQIAIAWTLAQGEHVIPIPGTKRLRYLEENLAAADLHLTSDDLRDLDGLPEARGERY